MLRILKARQLNSCSNQLAFLLCRFCFRLRWDFRKLVACPTSFLPACERACDQLPQMRQPVNLRVDWS